MMDPETFTTLLKNPGHWEFELFLMFLQDVILGLLILPLARRHFMRYHPKWKQKIGEVTKIGMTEWTDVGPVRTNSRVYFDPETAKEILRVTEPS